MKIFLIALAAGIVAIPVFLVVVSSPPVVTFPSPPKVVGSDMAIQVRIESPHGVRRVTAAIEQNGVRYPLVERSEPATRLFWRKRQAPTSLAPPISRKTAPALKDGKAKLIVEAQANDLRAAEASSEIEFEFISAPPKVAADDFQHYINQGGCELTEATVSGYWTEAGVRVGPYTFRSFPMPGSKSGERFSLFAFPWDLPATTVPIFFARNPGQEATARFWFKVFPKKFRVRDLAIDDTFLEKVDSQIDHGATGSLLDRFLKINGDLRRKNNQTLADLRLKTVDHFLWSKPFLQLANSKVESFFADRRSYIYKGKKVDEQVHLGFDLSVTKHVAVPSANDGRVVYAADLGIYGNCVVVDHGYGLQSIYGHLNSIEVKEGDMVKQSQTLGRSGSTGLAGGDHLHYSMQVDGVQVNPVEWWDAHWIKDRVHSKLAQ